MPVTLKTNSFKYRDDSSEEWSPALVQATAPLEPAFQDIGKLASELGIVVNGNTAAVNIAAGQYIILKNSTISGKEDGLYVAANAVSAGTALQSTDIPAAAITNGGLNALNDKITNLSSVEITESNFTQTGTYRIKTAEKIGKMIHIMYSVVFTVGLGDVNLGTVPNGYRPSIGIKVPCIMRVASNEIYPAYARIDSNGQIHQDISNNCTGLMIDSIYYQ